MGFLTRGDGRVFNTERPKPGLSHKDLTSGNGAFPNQSGTHHKIHNHNFTNSVLEKIKENRRIEAAKKSEKIAAKKRREDEITKKQKELSDLKHGKHISSNREKLTARTGGHRIVKIREKEQVGVLGKSKVELEEPRPNEKLHDATGIHKVNPEPKVEEIKPTPSHLTPANDINNSNPVDHDLKGFQEKRPRTNSEVAVIFAKPRG